MSLSWHSYASGAFTRTSGNDKGLYATMKRWRIDP